MKWVVRSGAGNSRSLLQSPTQVGTARYWSGGRYLPDRGPQGGKELVDRHPMHFGGPLYRQGLGDELTDVVSGYPLDPEQFHHFGDVAVLTENVLNLGVLRDFHPDLPSVGPVGYRVGP